MAVFLVTICRLSFTPSMKRYNTFRLTELIGYSVFTIE